MRAWFLQVADRLRSSYWFLPSIMAFAAIVLGIVMPTIDVWLGPDWMSNVPWLHVTRPDGARQLLSSIGGSMITVAGTVFSVTIAAVVYASGQYGPRLLSNFMQDRGNQVTLGTFIATFVYCLMILRTVQSPEESGGVGFVPNTALLLGLVLALCSIAVLIFFIHHVPSKIHINNVIREIGARLIVEIDDRFPIFIGRPMEDEEANRDTHLPRAFREDATVEEAKARTLIRAKATGYISLVDDEALIRIAREKDIVIRLQYQPGDFVYSGRTIAEACPPDQCDDAAAIAIRSAFSVSSRRSALQDIRFLFDELVEIAARALSPGVNDPFTAITCLDWIGAALADLAGRRLPSALRMDEDDRLRVIGHPQTFALFADRAFGALVQYCAADMNGALRYIRALGDVAIECEDRERLACLRAHCAMLVELAEHSLSGANLRNVRERAEEFNRALDSPDYRRRLRDSTAWLGGTA